MKNLFTYFTIVAAIIVFAACQKELNFEPIPSNGLAVGTLKSTSGNCLPSSVRGVYYKDSVLKASNYINVDVDITSIGNYIIKSDTVAGFSFIGIGTVTSTGVNTIKLIGEGTPNSKGTKIFTVTFGTSSCKLSVQVDSSVVLPSTAVFTFGGGPSTCTGFILSGNPYTVGTPTNALQTVMLNVTVTSPGLYSVTTGAAINGLVFTASGSFNFGGGSANTVILTASGTPLAAGNFNYTITNGTSSCVFTIGVVAAPPVANLDYIPMTTNTNWTNRTVGTPPPNDTTFLQVSPNQKVFGANSYFIFERKALGVPQDSSYFRKNGGLYFQYINGKIGNTTVPVTQEYLVLDSTKQINGTWIHNFGNIVVGGFPLNGFTVNAIITAKGSNRIVEGINYNNVIEVEYNYTASGLGTVATEQRWFAKGIGIIYLKIDIPLIGNTVENNLIRSQIL